MTVSFNDLDNASKAQVLEEAKNILLIEARNSRDLQIQHMDADMTFAKNRLLSANPYAQAVTNYDALADVVVTQDINAKDTGQQATTENKTKDVDSFAGLTSL